MIEQIGRYEILDAIGEGSFAIVYRARDTELDRLVALKELKPPLLQDNNWIRQFRREARAIAMLDHPHIVTIYDVYQVANRLFIVMRLVDGPSLDKLIAMQGRLSWDKALEIAKGIANGLDYAHSCGILHRDLKPANILIDPKRGPRLSDFGLAKLMDDDGSTGSGGDVVGTPHYIAPEVWDGQGHMPQSDIYAFGCILYEMVTGEKLFNGKTTPVVMMSHFKPLTLPPQWPDDVPASLDMVLQTALSQRPSDRFTTATEMINALSALKTTPHSVLSLSQFRYQRRHHPTIL